MSFLKKLFFMRGRTLGIQVISLLVVLNVALIIWAINSLYNSKLIAEARAVTGTQNLALALDQTISASIEKVDLILLSVVGNLEHPAQYADNPKKLLANFLADNRQRLTALSALGVTDANGKVIALDHQQGINLATLAGEPDFYRLRQRGEATLIITPPFIDATTHQWQISFLHRYNHPDGTFAGAVFASIPLSYFSHLLATLNLSEGDLAALVDMHSLLIARYPESGKENIATQSSGYPLTQHVVKNSPLFDWLSQSIRSGLYTATFQVDDEGMRRMLTYRRLSVAPFHLVVGMGAQNYLSSWHQEVWRTLAVIGFFIFFSSGMGWLLWRAAMRIQNETARSQLLLRSASDGVHILDQNGVIVEASHSFYSMLGYRPDELAEKTIGDWSIRHSIHSVRVLLDDLAFNHAPTIFETEYRHKNGSIFDVEVSVYPLELDGHMVLCAAARDITERKRSQQQLLANEARFRAFFEKNRTVMLLVDPDNGEIILANQAAADYYGYSLSALISMDLFDLNTLSASEVSRHMQEVMNNDRSFFCFNHRNAQGDIYDVEIYSTPINFSGRSLIFSIVHDITDRRQTEIQLRRAASVFSHSREGILVTTPDGVIVDVNQAACDITGYSQDELIGKTPRLLKSGRQNHEYYSAMWNNLLRDGHLSCEIWNRRKNGELYAQLQNISVVRNEQGDIEHFVSLFSDITSIKQHQSELERIAHHDPLTGLPNRSLLSDRLHQAMLQSQRHGLKLAVLYLDLDGFKQVNDTGGHEAGDQLLITIANRMKAALREVDTLARLGGDEFVMVITALSSHEVCLRVLERLLIAVNQPVMVDNIAYKVSASIGVTFYPQTEHVYADQLLRQADQAMYQAKLAGKSRYQLFDTEQARSVRGYHESLEHIQSALSCQQFILYYQPKVNLRTGEVVGVEALIRWDHPDKGILPPSAFLPVIEDHPLSVQVGEWVIRQALQQMQIWQAQGLKMPVSVNISGNQLQRDDFIERLNYLLAEYPSVSPHDLELEVLENSALEDIVRISRVIKACRDIGVRFALDDFGTGYSSLSYLKHLPVSLLKIDQSFVRDIGDVAEDVAILRGILGLAAALKHEVLVEGVETQEQAKILLSIGCELAQGYCFARPMSSRDFQSWLVEWRMRTDVVMA